jgi:hypothetical protein
MRDDTLPTFFATPARRAPLPPGHVLIRGLTSDGYGIAVRLPADSAEAKRLTAETAARRERALARHAFVAAVDDPAVPRAEVERLRHAAMLPSARRRAEEMRQP